ncbi:type III secretion system export apparatus subunit SctR [Desulfovibrio inopinatus]|uniref:type III secretion system export apparatus subunit SctR n=1 Tax=Desulfovibrio inopinatus TaxID=102109 RepID=UPI000419C61D|nr:type III secretion system export apparatus subunit SctR [Desulfovibrio inopinatus]
MSVFDLGPVTVIVVLSVLALLPFIAVMTTSYVKLTVVLSLLRNALGTQGVPSNLVVNAFAIVLTLFIMAPIFSETIDLVEQNAPQEFTGVESVRGLFEKSKGPFQEFLYKFTSLETRTFFYRAAHKLWPKKHVEGLGKDAFSILIPSFLVCELKRAFEIGLLLYLPFVVLDLVIANILMAMGMMMVQPSTISMPFKLLLFVTLDGWTLVTQGLILSYQ